MYDRTIMCNYADSSQNEDWASHLKVAIMSNSGEKRIQIERTWYDENGSINGATLNQVVEWKALKKSLRTKERRENVLQSCHPFDIQLYRTLESAVQIALKEATLVFGGFSCLCRKEGKEEEESLRHSEKHRAKQSRTKGETSNTNCRSQWPRHKHLLLHPESRQLLAHASKLCFSKSFFGWTTQKPVITAERDRPEGTWIIQNFTVRKTSLKSLKSSQSLYLQYALSAAKVWFKRTSSRKGTQHSQSFFSSSFLLPKNLQIQVHACRAAAQAGPCQQACQLQTFLSQNFI